jgi:hemolysin activation/secretion protein
MHWSMFKSVCALRAALVVLLCTHASITFARNDVLLNSPFITGSTRYSAAELIECFAPRIGQPVTRGLLDAIAAEIQARYRRDGLVSPSVVALDSELTSATPRLHVFEASIDEIALRGDSGPYLETIMEQAHELRTGAIDKRGTQNYLRRLNELPGLSVRARFEPRDGASNRFTLVLDSRYEAVEGSISVDNRGTAALGRTMVAGSTRFNGIAGTHSALTLSAATSDQPERYRYLGAGIEWDMAATRARLDVADSNAEFANRYHYHAQRARLEVRTTALRSDTLLVEPMLRLTFRDSEGRYPALEVSDVRTRVAAIGLLARLGSERASGYARWSISRGIDGFGAFVDMRNTEPDMTFSSTSLDLAIVYLLATDWLLRLDAEAQWSDAHLPAGERFAFGGSTLGRGFDPGELIGDRGAAIGLQLERMQRWGGEWLRNTSVYVQSDYGYASDSDRGSDNAASVTAGFKAVFASLLAELELSTPVNRSAEHPHASDPRAFVRMQLRF